MIAAFLIGFTAQAVAPSTAPQPAAPVQTAPVPAVAAPSTSAPAPVAPTPPAEVATIIAQEFPAYDKDRDGALSQNEFGEWMVKLKTIADPASTANEAATKTWVNAAFAQADTDRSKSLTLGELTGFLSQG